MGALSTTCSPQGAMETLERVAGMAEIGHLAVPLGKLQLGERYEELAAAARDSMADCEDLAEKVHATPPSELPLPLRMVLGSGFLSTGEMLQVGSLSLAARREAICNVQCISMSIDGSQLSGDSGASVYDALAPMAMWVLANGRLLRRLHTFKTDGWDAQGCQGSTLVAALALSEAPLRVLTGSLFAPHTFERDEEEWQDRIRDTDVSPIRRLYCQRGDSLPESPDVLPVYSPTYAAVGHLQQLLQGLLSAKASTLCCVGHSALEDQTWALHDSFAMESDCQCIEKYEGLLVAPLMLSGARLTCLHTELCYCAGAQQNATLGLFRDGADSLREVFVIVSADGDLDGPFTFQNMDRVAQHLGGDANGIPMAGMGAPSAQNPTSFPPLMCTALETLRVQVEISDEPVPDKWNVLQGVLGAVAATLRKNAGTLQNVYLDMVVSANTEATEDLLQALEGVAHLKRLSLRLKLPWMNHGMFDALEEADEVPAELTHLVAPEPQTRHMVEARLGDGIRGVLGTHAAELEALCMYVSTAQDALALLEVAPMLTNLKHFDVETAGRLRFDAEAMAEDHADAAYEFGIGGALPEDLVESLDAEVDEELFGGEGWPLPEPVMEDASDAGRAWQQYVHSAAAVLCHAVRTLGSPLTDVDPTWYSSSDALAPNLLTRRLAALAAHSQSLTTLNIPSHSATEGWWSRPVACRALQTLFSAPDSALASVTLPMPGRCSPEEQAAVDAVASTLPPLRDVNFAASGRQGVAGWAGGFNPEVHRCNLAACLAALQFKPGVPCELKVGFSMQPQELRALASALESQPEGVMLREVSLNLGASHDGLEPSPAAAAALWDALATAPCCRDIESLTLRHVPPAFFASPSFLPALMSLYKLKSLDVRAGDMEMCCISLTDLPGEEDDDEEPLPGGEMEDCSLQAMHAMLSRTDLPDDWVRNDTAIYGYFMSKAELGKGALTKPEQVGQLNQQLGRVLLDTVAAHPLTPSTPELVRQTVQYVKGGERLASNSKRLHDIVVSIVECQSGSASRALLQAAGQGHWKHLGKVRLSLAVATAGDLLSFSNIVSADAPTLCTASISAMAFEVDLPEQLQKYGQTCALAELQGAAEDPGAMGHTVPAEKAAELLDLPVAVVQAYRRLALVTSLQRVCFEAAGGGQAFDPARARKSPSVFQQIQEDCGIDIDLLPFSYRSSTITVSEPIALPDRVKSGAVVLPNYLSPEQPWTTGVASGSSSDEESEPGSDGSDLGSIGSI